MDNSLPENVKVRRTMGFVVLKTALKDPSRVPALAFTKKLQVAGRTGFGDTVGQGSRDVSSDGIDRQTIRRREV